MFRNCFHVMEPARVMSGGAEGRRATGGMGGMGSAGLRVVRMERLADADAGETGMGLSFGGYRRH